jgi:hypothetical protein
MRRPTALAVLGVGVVASQAGHLLAYQVRFGGAAQQLQNSGAHAYFPLLAKTTLGAIAAAFVAGLFVIGLARVLTGRSRLQRSSERSSIGLLAALFTIQLACFITQEVAEAMVAGLAVDSAPHLLLWGTLGQLPVAAAAAVALGWLWTRFESAVDDLRAVLAIVRAPRAPTAVAGIRWPAPDRALLLSQMPGGSPGKRGPPPSSRFSS